MKTANTIKDIIAAITAEENENATVQVFVSADGYRYALDGDSSAHHDEVAVYGEAEQPTVAEFFSPMAEDLLADDIAKVSISATIDCDEIASDIFDMLTDCSDNDAPIYDWENDGKTLVIDADDRTWQLAGSNNLYRGISDIDIDLDTLIEEANDSVDTFAATLAAAIKREVKKAIR